MYADVTVTGDFNTREPISVAHPDSIDMFINPEGVDVTYRFLYDKSSRNFTIDPVISKFTPKVGVPYIFTFKDMEKDLYISKKVIVPRPIVLKNSKIEKISEKEVTNGFEYLIDIKLDLFNTQKDDYLLISFADSLNSMAEIKEIQNNNEAVSILKNTKGIAVNRNLLGEKLIYLTIAMTSIERLTEINIITENCNEDKYRFEKYLSDIHNSNGMSQSIIPLNFDEKYLIGIVSSSSVDKVRIEL